MRNITISSLFFLWAIFAQAQNWHFGNPSKTTEIESILAQFDEDRKLQYLALAPNINYDALNNSFNIGISVSNLTNYFQTRHRNRIEKARLKVQLEEKAFREEIQAAADLEKANINILEFQAAFQEYIIQALNFDIYTQLYQIQQGKHQAGDITTEDFLRQKLSFTNQFQNLLMQAERLLIKTRSLQDPNLANSSTSILQFQKEKLLQTAKNFGVLGAEPLDTRGEDKSKE